MKFLKEHHCPSPEIQLEIKKGELKLENLINKYRLFLLTFSIIADFVIAHFAGFLKPEYFILGIPSMVLVYFGLFKLHKLTKCTKPKPYLKYITIVLDYTFVTIMVFEMQHILPDLTRIEPEKLLLMGTMFYMVINTFSALRIQKQVIGISTLLGIALNTFVHSYFGSSSLIMAYTGFFILVTGFFNQFVSKYIFNFFANNYQLSKANVEIKNANEEIQTQNEEIQTQNDELATQNDYLAEQRDQISEQKKHITSSIEYASRIQEALLGSHNDIKKVFPDSFALFHPKDIVSGDFYWYKNVEVFTKKYQVFTAVDCTGHGVPGAFMSMLGISFLNEIVGEFYDELNAAQVLNRLREEVKKSLHQGQNSHSVKDGMDMALCAINYQEMKLQFAGANNPLYIIRNINGQPANEIEEYKPDKMPIGVYIKEKESFTNQIIDVNKGDLLYVFSDGFIDQFGGKNGEKFKKRRFRELLLSVSHLPIDEQKSKLETTLNSWMGTKHEQLDDITVIGVRV